LSVSTTKPGALDDGLEAAGRDRILPPMTPHDFLPDLRNVPQRTDVRPLHIVQPEGVSFRMTDHVLEWQKWRMHVGT